MAITTFTEIFQRIDTTVVNTIASGTVNLINVVSPVMLAGFTCYMLFVFFSYWQGSSVEGTMVDLIKRNVAWAVIIGLSMNIGNYNHYVLPAVLHLGDNLSQAFSGQPASNASVLDALATQLVDVMDKTSAFAEKSKGISGIAIKLETYIKNFILLFFFCIFLVIAAAYIMLAKVFLAILAVVGPIFIVMALFPVTRNLASAWGMQVLNYSLLLLFLNITAGVFVGYLALSMVDLSTLDVVSNISMIHNVLATLMFAIILLKLPELASGLAGGIAANGFANVMNIATSIKRLGSGGGKGGSGGGKGGGSVSSANKPENKGK